MIRHIHNRIIARITAILLAITILCASTAKAYTIEDDGPILKAGTTIRLQTLHTVESQHARVGDQIQLRVMQDVIQDRMVLIPAGASAIGQIANAKSAGAFGAAGELELRLVSVTAADGSNVAINGVPIQKAGQDKQTMSILLGVFVCFLFWFMEGEQVSIPEGTELLGSVTYDIELR